jgi:hypothetical protein
MYGSVEVKFHIFLRVWLKMEASSQFHTLAFSYGTAYQHLLHWKGIRKDAESFLCF